MLILAVAHQQQIEIEAERTYPEECCGILLGQLERDVQKTVIEVWPTPNAWSQAVAADLASAISASRHPAQAARRDRYWIDPRDLLKAQREARDRSLQMIGIYHSHPDHPAIPSETDRRLAWPEYSYLILSVEQGKVMQVLSWQLDAAHQFQSEVILAK
jgi:proteasome lid subunit RPN8/RPN11